MKNVTAKTSAAVLSLAILGGVGIATAAPAAAATVSQYYFTDKVKATAYNKCLAKRSVLKSTTSWLVGDCAYVAPRGKSFLHEYDLTVIK